MKKSITGKACVVLLAVTLGACATGTSVNQTGGSGFLRDYYDLQEARDAQGKPIRVWVSPKLTPANYDAILLDPLVFYPEPRPSEQVSAETLHQFLAYSNETLKRSVSQQFKMVDHAGPGVLQIRAAFSGVAAQGEGLSLTSTYPLRLWLP